MPETVTVYSSSNVLTEVFLDLRYRQVISLNLILIDLHTSVTRISTLDVNPFSHVPFCGSNLLVVEKIYTVVHFQKINTRAAFAFFLINIKVYFC